MVTIVDFFIWWFLLKLHWNYRNIILIMLILLFSPFRLQLTWLRYYKTIEQIMKDIAHSFLDGYWVKTSYRGQNVKFSPCRNPRIKGILWDCRWSPPSIRIYSHTCWFVYRNAFLIMKLSKPPSFKVIRALIASQSTFEI